MAVRPGEAMRIAQAERPDLLARAGGRHERVVVRNAVAAVVAENARRLMVRRVRNDPQDFADERVEALRVHAGAALGFARSAVAASDVEHAPLAVAAARRRVEAQVGQRVDPRVERHAHQLARRAFERRIRRTRVGPFDEHPFALDRSRRRNGRRRRVPREVQRRQVRVVGDARAGQRRILDMDRVELPVRAVVGIELNAVQAVRVADFVGELAEQTAMALAAVEVEIDGELRRRFVENVERSIEIVHEESRRAAGLLAERVDAREHAVGLSFAVQLSGDRHLDVVGDIDRHRRIGGGQQARGQHDRHARRSHAMPFPRIPAFPCALSPSRPP